MTNITELETKVLNTLNTPDDLGLNARQLIEETELNAQALGAVLRSLKEKDLIEFNDELAQVQRVFELNWFSTTISKMFRSPYDFT